jgi:hypothetical protein
MKRVGNIYNKIADLDNISLADEIARKGKKNSYGIKLHDRNREANINQLYQQLVNSTYSTSEYNVFDMLTDAGKTRRIYRLPYYPDRMCHHAIMNVLEPIFVNSFIRDTYVCIKGRGIHDGVARVKQALRDKEATKYCLKLDIHKFFPSIDNSILKKLLRRKFKDNKLLKLLDEIVDSADGVPIGNYLSQYFANFYLNYFDHWLKEVKGVKYYFRYCDDMVILSDDKRYLHTLRYDIEKYLNNNLNLKLKDNYQVFPVESRGIDFLGYVFYHDYTKLRKRIKKNFARKLKNASQKKRKEVIASYKGWCMYGNCINLYFKLTGMKTFKELGVKVESSVMVGDKIKINRVINKEIEVKDYELNESKFKEQNSSQCLKLQIKYEDELRVIFTGANQLIEAIRQISKDVLPFKTTIVETNGYYQFT